MSICSFFQLLKSEERNVSQMRDHYGTLSNGYAGLDDMPADEGYQATYDNRDVDPRIARRFYRQQQIAKT